MTNTCHLQVDGALKGNEFIKSESWISTPSKENCFCIYSFVYEFTHSFNKYSSGPYHSKYQVNIIDKSMTSWSLYSSHRVRYKQINKWMCNIMSVISPMNKNQSRVRELRIRCSQGRPVWGGDISEESWVKWGTEPCIKLGESRSEIGLCFAWAGTARNPGNQSQRQSGRKGSRR